ncbi:hypothetical protein Z945_1551 [Sulfitobacter noctilucae]|uniref:hypothetical protein n=1 Tax=Sulfitobacter noctilucae TaxID=1342302 RepID=UPI00046976B3|nr:hypothetical protein [Sulfitobacter noctilucae]KIN60576.1 hypothetical protein Z945_1551 [Sulfitobacter noctilucae]
MVEDGYTVFDSDPATLRWATAAGDLARAIANDPQMQRANLRHAKTWFVGVDVLPNATDGSIGEVPLQGPLEKCVAPQQSWHRAQLSIVYPGYPGQDKDESDANHRYRIKRHAAHVDGLLPIGPARRRYLREPHAFILGLPLNEIDAAPLMVWPGSHHVMGDALRAEIGDVDPQEVDLTEAYQAARRKVFETTAARPVRLKPGQSVLLHRHLLHGVASWGSAAPSDEGRMIAYFRPQFTAEEWINP